MSDVQRHAEGAPESVRTAPVPMIREPITGPRAWTRRTIRESDWRLAVPPRCLDELERLARRLERDPVPTWLLDPSDYELHACRDLLREVRRRLDEGPGVVVVDRLPIENFSGRPQIEAVFWLLAAMVGRPVVQTLDGRILVEVTDTGVKKTIGVRGFRTHRRVNLRTPTTRSITRRRTT